LRPLRPLVAVAFFAAGFACAQPRIDYAREERLAQEILPTLMTGDAVYLRTPSRARVLALETRPSGAAKGAVVIVHGLGVHPDFGMIGTLRGLLADAGYVTLAVQMPVLPADAPRDEYAATFDAAGERLAAAVARLRDTGPGRVAIVAHSMGASMTDAYLARPTAARIDAWVPVGMLVPFSVAPREPVLDVLAERDLQPVVETSPARKKALPPDRCSGQVRIAGADHYFEGSEKVLTQEIVRFLDRVGAGGC
jgi:dienelactone hydrolase